MIRSAALFLALLATTATAGSMSGGGSSGARIALRPQPSFILIMLDDVGPEMIDAFGASAWAMNMPSIDTLASNGAILDTFWTGVVCAPTRASLNTGRYNFRHLVYDAGNTNGISTHETFFVESLAAAGYATAHVGKYGLNTTAWPDVLSPDEAMDATEAYYTSPIMHGWGYYAGAVEATIPSHYSWPRVEATAIGVYSPLDPETTPETQWALSQQFDDAIAWRAAHLAANPTQPYVLMIAPNIAHELPEPPAPYDGCTTGSDCLDEVFADLDNEISQLLSTITTPQRSNTFVIFMADNGSGAVGGAGGKFASTNTGYSQPAVVAFGSVASSIRGTTISGLRHVVDIGATLRDYGLARHPTRRFATDPDSEQDHPVAYPSPIGPLYQGQARVEDGVSWRTALSGGSTTAHACIMSSAAAVYSIRCASHDEYVYTRTMTTSAEALYHWPTSESVDVSATYPSIESDLSDELDALLATEPPR